MGAWRALVGAAVAAAALTCTSQALAASPTTLTTELAGGGQEGASITVPENTEVTDGATVSGENAATAGGTVTYSVYSDSECTSLVAEAGPVEVSDGVAERSSPETLAPGTYYWLAKYSGDEDNEESSSTCGSEVETVSEAAPPPPECNGVTGSAGVAIRKEGEVERETLSNSLSKTEGAKEKLIFRWESGANVLKLTNLTSATCTIRTHSQRFAGTGEATVNEEEGWTVKFSLGLTTGGHFVFHVRATKPEQEPLVFTFKAAKVSGETFS